MASSNKKLVREAGAFSINKGELVGDPERKNQDAFYCDEDAGVFCVFDGVGGLGGGHLASKKAADVVSSLVSNYGLGGQDAIRNALVLANDGVRNECPGAATTAVIGQVISDEFGKKLIFGSVGDSSIFIVRDGDALQVTNDAIEGYIFDNCLGKRNLPAAKVPQQVDEVRLKEGDQLVFCTNGITKNKTDDFIPTVEIAQIVVNADTPEKAAVALVQRATKVDDRTAVVVKI